MSDDGHVVVFIAQAPRELSDPDVGIAISRSPADPTVSTDRPLSPAPRERFRSVTSVLFHGVHSSGCRSELAGDRRRVPGVTARWSANAPFQFRGRSPRARIRRCNSVETLVR